MGSRNKKKETKNPTTTSPPLYLARKYVLNPDGGGVVAPLLDDYELARFTTGEEAITWLIKQIHEECRKRVSCSGSSYPEIHFLFLNQTHSHLSSCWWAFPLGKDTSGTLGKKLISCELPELTFEPSVRVTFVDEDQHVTDLELPALQVIIVTDHFKTESLTEEDMMSLF